MGEAIKNRYEFVVLFDVENGNPTVVIERHVKVLESRRQKTRKSRNLLKN